jgi:hypothetical protein
MSDSAVAAAVCVPRSTIRDWRRSGFARAGAAFRRSECPRCDGRSLDEHAYAYLLGLYLGDGHLAEHPGNVFRLRVFLDASYPEIIEECRSAVSRVRMKDEVTPGVVGGRGCVYVSSYWKHWACLFPQHGPGAKHARPIELERWQDEIVRGRPGPFLRGLIHSDGCRVLNRVGRREYVRYMFCNHSKDVLRLFCRACVDFGIAPTRPSWRTISVARAHDVERLDQVVGPKT